jgi:hypothetical protein
MTTLGQNVSPRLIEALGLPKHTMWFELRVAAGEIASVKCAYHPERDGVELADVILTEYQLVERTP